MTALPSPATATTPAEAEVVAVVPRDPARPWLPWIALGVVVGALAPNAVAFALGWQVDVRWIALVAAPSLALALIALAPRMPLASRLLGFAAACLVGAALAQLRQPSDPASERLLAVEGTVASVRREGYSQTVVLSPAHALTPERPIPHLLLIAREALPGLVVGDVVRANGIWSRDGRGEELDAVTLERRELREDGSRGWAWRALDRVGDRRVLAEALLIGQGDPPEQRDFRRAGLLHVLAVSGMHLAIAAGLATWLLRVLGVGWWTRLGIVVALIAGYTWLTAASPATVRALAMGLALAAMTGLAREPHRLAAVSLAALVLVAWDPANAASIGFQLSLAAVLGIVTLGLDLVHLRQRLLPLMPWPLDRPTWRGLLWCARSALDGLAIGVAASLATTPLIAAHFLSANPWSPIATLVTAPQTTGALWLGLPCMALAGIFPSGPWEGLYAGLDGCLDALAAAVSWAASWPGATMRVAAPSAATMLLWPALFMPLRDARDLALRAAALACLLLLW